LTKAQKEADAARNKEAEAAAKNAAAEAEEERFRKQQAAEEKRAKLKANKKAKKAKKKAESEAKLRELEGQQEQERKEREDQERRALEEKERELLLLTEAEKERLRREAEQQRQGTAAAANKASGTEEAAAELEEKVGGPSPAKCIACEFYAGFSGFCSSCWKKLTVEEQKWHEDTYRNLGNGGNALQLRQYLEMKKKKTQDNAQSIKKQAPKPATELFPRATAAPPAQLIPAPAPAPAPAALSSSAPSFLGAPGPNLSGNAFGNVLTPQSQPFGSLGQQRSSPVVGQPAFKPTQPMMSTDPKMSSFVPFMPMNPLVAPSSAYAAVSSPLGAPSFNPTGAAPKSKLDSANAFPSLAPSAGSSAIAGTKPSSIAPGPSNGFGSRADDPFAPKGATPASTIKAPTPVATPFGGGAKTHDPFGGNSFGRSSPSNLPALAKNAAPFFPSSTPISPIPTLANSAPAAPAAAASIWEPLRPRSSGPSSAVAAPGISPLLSPSPFSAPTTTSPFSSNPFSSSLFSFTAPPATSHEDDGWGNFMPGNSGMGMMGSSATSAFDSSFSDGGSSFSYSSTMDLPDHVASAFAFIPEEPEPLPKPDRSVLIKELEEKLAAVPLSHPLFTFLLSFLTYCSCRRTLRTTSTP